MQRKGLTGFSCCIQQNNSSYNCFCFPNELIHIFLGDFSRFKRFSEICQSEFRSEHFFLCHFNRRTKHCSDGAKTGTMGSARRRDGPAQHRSCGEWKDKMTGKFQELLDKMKVKDPDDLIKVSDSERADFEQYVFDAFETGNIYFTPHHYAKRKDGTMLLTVMIRLFPGNCRDLIEGTASFVIPETWNTSASHDDDLPDVDDWRPIGSPYPPGWMD